MARVRNPWAGTRTEFAKASPSRRLIAAREAREQKASVEMANRQSMGMGGGFGGMMTDAMAPAT